MSKKKDVTGLDSFYTQLKNGDVTKGLKTLEKIAKSVSIEEFNKFVNTKELPTVKLNSDDLKALNGGWLIKVLEIIIKSSINANGNDTGGYTDSCGVYHAEIQL